MPDTLSRAVEAAPANAGLIARLKNVPAIAKTVMLAATRIRGGAVVMALPDGRAFQFGDGAGPTQTLNIRDYKFARRVFTNGDIGLAEGLMAGEWDSPDLAGLLSLLADNAERYTRLFDGGRIRRFFNRLFHRANENTREGSKRNILAHYDLGNTFYQQWLDPTMTYSSARFDAGQRDLEVAQVAKYRALAEHLQLKSGEHVLEIGCGWGGFAEFAAREYGVRVTGLTISDEQLRFARERIAHAGLGHLVEIRHQDYRDVAGQFDKVASIEMFEAVGEKYWPAYFAKIAEVLKPGGRAALQIITIKDELFEDYRRRTDFIQRYVFPGGMLASIACLRDEVARAGLDWCAADAFGQSYADTLAAWRQRFLARWNDIRDLGFDEKFKQLWRFYLSYCEAGFRTGRTDVVQLELVRP